MKTIFKLLFIILVLTSCASTTQYVKYSPVNSVTNGKAKICIVRKRTAFGASIKSKIYQDKKLVGKLGYASFLSWESEPKESFIIATTENKDSIKIDLKKDKIYYLRLNYKTGFLIARADLKIIDKDEFMKILRKAKKPKIKSF